MSPENLVCPVVEKSDVYSFGMTIMLTCVDLKFAFQMLYTPLRDKNQLNEARKALRQNKLLALIMSMVCHMPNDRPNLEEVTNKLHEILVDHISRQDWCSKTFVLLRCKIYYYGFVLKHHHSISRTIPNLV